MERRGSSIPRYQLYGEDAEVRSFEFVHIEALRYRSEIHDWTIDVHTHVGLAQVAVFLTGGLVLAVDGRTLTVEAPSVVTIPTGTAHGFDLEPGSTGYVVMLADERLDGAQLGRWLRSTLFSSPAVVGLDAATATRIDRLCEQLLDEQQCLDPAHDAMTQWLTLTLLTVAARRAASASEQQRDEVDRYGPFRRLVESHFTEHRAVSWYASSLNLSESTLNRVCEAAAGRSAFEIIQSRLELEARRRLRYTTVAIGPLAAELGFADPSYFSRFFRRRTGCSPSDFRAGLDQ